MRPARSLGMQQLTGSNDNAPSGLSTTDRALAIALRNLNGPRDKDLLGTAEALNALRHDPSFRTADALAREVGVSREIVREFLALLKLPPAVQELFRSGDLRTLEQGRRLYQLQLHRPRLVQAAAQAMIGMSAHQSRGLVDYLLRHPDVDIGSAVEVLDQSATRMRKEFHIIAELDEDAYRLLSRRAKRERLSPVDLVTKIVKEWLARAEHGR